MFPRKLILLRTEQLGIINILLNIFIDFIVGTIMAMYNSNQMMD